MKPIFTRNFLAILLILNRQFNERELRRVESSDKSYSIRVEGLVIVSLPKNRLNFSRPLIFEGGKFPPKHAWQKNDKNQIT